MFAVEKIMYSLIKQSMNVSPLSLIRESHWSLLLRNTFSVCVVHYVFVHFVNKLFLYSYTICDVS